MTSWLKVSKPRKDIQWFTSLDASGERHWSSYLWEFPIESWNQYSQSLRRFEECLFKMKKPISIRIIKTSVERDQIGFRTWFIRLERWIVFAWLMNVYNDSLQDALFELARHFRPFWVELSKSFGQSTSFDKLVLLRPEYNLVVAIESTAQYITYDAARSILKREGPFVDGVLCVKSSINLWHWNRSAGRFTNYSQRIRLFTLRFGTCLLR